MFILYVLNAGDERKLDRNPKLWQEGQKVRYGYVGDIRVDIEGARGWLYRVVAVVTIWGDPVFSLYFKAN